MSARARIPARIKLRLQVARSRSGFADVAWRTYKSFSGHDGGFYSAALTYYLFLSIFPLLLFAASIVGYLTFGNESLREDILTAELAAIPLLDQILTPENLNSIETRRQAIALFGSLLALYSGTGAVVALSHALNRINGVTDERGFLARRSYSILWLVILGATSTISLGLGTLSGYAVELFDTGTAQVLGIALGHVVGFAVGLVIFATAFRFLTTKDTSWRGVLPGAIMASAGFEILKELGAWYLERGAGGREATFGAFATAAGLLVASYLIAQVTLLSAELNAVLAERRATRHSGH